MKIAIIGATGLVGGEILDVLEEFEVEISEILLVATAQSVGKTLAFKNSNHTIIGMEEAILCKPDIAIFSAGGAASLSWAPKFAEVGTTVIDNSSAWRMSPDHKLIVPEINADTLTDSDKIIANPNCSTIQLVLVLAPLHAKYAIKRVVISTYQSISGTGIKAINQLHNEKEGIDGEMAYPYPIAENCLPHCDDFLDNGYTKEEMKLSNETKKILDSAINLTATAVRVPVSGGHSEAVNIEFENDFNLSDVRQLISETAGIVLKDNPETNEYPMPLYAKGKNDVFVGRIRRDESQEKSLNLWIVADNLRKGAATNAVQIAQYIIKKKLVQV
jgi:aspartate-semialdehyde dehydrogenase